LKQEIEQLLQFYEKSINETASVDDASALIGKFGKTLINRLLDFFPNLQTEFGDLLRDAPSPEQPISQTSVHNSQISAAISQKKAPLE